MFRGGKNKLLLLDKNNKMNGFPQETQKTVHIAAMLVSQAKRITPTKGSMAAMTSGEDRQ